eukprot:XP_001705894.1 Hypothetical protein GL50803_37815 [Giardia lamblia ATCC 50803]
MGTDGGDKTVYIVNQRGLKNMWCNSSLHICRLQLLIISELTAVSGTTVPVVW